MKLVDNIVLMGGLFAAGVSTAEAATFTVSSLADGFGTDSLRGAINAVNCQCAISPPHTIAFSVMGDLQLDFGGLPAISCPGTTVDGYTHPNAGPNSIPPGGAGSNARVVVGLPASANVGAVGLTLDAANVTLRGLYLTGYSTAAIDVTSNCTNCVVEGNFINIKPDDTPTSGVGVNLLSSSARVGGAAAGQRNLIASFSGEGVLLGAAGVVENNSFNTTRGGAALTGAGKPAIFVNGSGSTIKTNVFSTSSMTSLAFNPANSTLSSVQVTGNTFKGVARAMDIWGFSHNIASNVIVNSATEGIVVRGSSHIIDNNSISGSGAAGIAFGSSPSGNAQVTSNFIETSQGWGIDSPGQGTVIDGNTITANRDGGVKIFATDVIVSANSIYGNNGKIAVDNGNDGPDVNDDVTAPYDLDSQDVGPNERQNHPKILSVVHSGGNTQVRWQLRTEPKSSFSPGFVDFYSNFAIPAVPEGQTWIHSENIDNATMTIDAVAAEYGAVTVIAGLHDNISMTTAIDKCGDSCWASSEYSPAVAATAPPSVFAMFVPAAIALGQSTSLQVVVANPNSGITLNSVAYTLVPPTGLSISSANVGSNCDAGGSGYSAGGTSGSVSNLTMPPGAQCTIDYFMTPTAEGAYTFASGALSVSSANGGTGSNTTSSTLAVSFIPPTFAIGSPSTTVAGMITPILVSVSRGASDPNYAGIAARLDLPGGATIASPPNAGTACGATLDVAAGNTYMAASGGSINSPTGGCQVVGANVIFPSPGTFTLTLDPGDASITSPKAYSNPAAVSFTIVVNPAPAPAADLAPATLTFAGQPVGTTSIAQTVTLKNTGTADMTGIVITTTGEFARSAGCTLTTLAPGASCTMSITFTPKALGTRNGALQVASNASGSPHSVALTGTGAPAPAPSASLSQTSVVFGSTPIGSTSAAQNVQLKNVGSADLVVTNITVVGDFAYGGCGFPLTLAPGAFCDLAITFHPLTAGVLPGAIDITSNASGSPHRISLSGTGSSIAMPVLNTRPGELTFGTLALGASATQRIRVHNGGSASLSITDIVASGTGFSQGNDCPLALAIGAGCNIDVTYAPTVAGVHVGQVVIRSNAEPDPYVVPLSGEGLAAPPAALSVSRFTVDFGQQIVGTSARQALQLQNVGGQPLVVSEMRASAPFAVEGACGTIVPGASCDVVLVFTPDAIRTFASALEIASNQPAGAVRVELLGIGVRVPTPEIELSLGGIGFGNQGVGTTSAAQFVTVRSIGGTAVELLGFNSTPDFLVDAVDCPAVLAADASCRVALTFRPLAAGPRSGRFSVLSNMAGEPASASLTGTGCRFFSIGAGRNPGRLCSP